MSSISDTNNNLSRLLLSPEDLEAQNCAHAVINAYSTTMAITRNEQKGFDAAVRAWTERNPTGSISQAKSPVASIISRKL